MCTSIAWNNGDFYIGRNMDISFDFDRKITIVPRNFPFTFKELSPLNHHFSIMGTAMIVNNYPLFAEAINEKGLYVAGLNFPNIAKYNKTTLNKNNVSVIEFIPYILCSASNVNEARKLLETINITDTPFLPSIAIPTLHFIISDKNTSLVVECTNTGMHIYENKIGILTNNPPFNIQMHNLNNYMHLSNQSPMNTLTTEVDLNQYCLGLGALGLPGDFSSQSRFVKACFLKSNAVASKTESASIAQMFRMLFSVAMVRGSVLDEDKYDITVYSCCYNATKGICYYSTYDSSAISAISLYNVDLDSNVLFSYPFNTNIQIYNQN